MPRLCRRDIAVLTALLDAHDGGATIGALMAATGFGHERVRRALGRLMAQGRVARVGSVRTANGRRPDVYTPTVPARQAAAA